MTRPVGVASDEAEGKLLLLLHVPRDAIGEDQEGRCPEANEDTEKLSMGADFECGILPSREVPDDDGAEH